MDTIEFTIPGEPVAKARPRLGRLGNTYTPGKTVNYETLVKEIFIFTYPEFKPFDCPVSVSLDIYMMIPESTNKKKRQAMLLKLIRPTKKPDIDNVFKIICDALNSIAYLDDKQIVSVYANKYYDDRPRVEVCIEKI